MPESSIEVPRENAPEKEYHTRSIPRTCYVHIRCLHCGKIESVDARSLVDLRARGFLRHMAEHTRDTGHKVEVTTTESFWITTL